MASDKQILSDMARVFTDCDPVTIQAAITDYCFNKCFMCDHYKRENKTYIVLERWLKFLRGLKNTKAIFYTGGDSIMHPQINEIMAEHTKLDIDFGFISSGYIPDSVDLQLLSMAKFFNVSLDSLDDANYEKLRGGIKLNKVLDSIEMALSYGINVNATVILSEQNFHELSDIINFCYDNGMNLRINKLYGKGNIELDLHSYTKFFKEKDLVLSVKNDSYTFAKCVVPYYSMFIDSKGNVYPCCVLGGDTEIDSSIEPLGNIEDFGKAKSERALFYLNNLPQKCSNCLSSFQKINNRFSKNPTINLNINESRNFY